MSRARRALLEKNGILAADHPDFPNGISAARDKLVRLKQMVSNFEEERGANSQGMSTAYWGHWLCVYAKIK